MADNLAITAGTGTTIATDDVSTVHYQKVKLVDGTADSSTVIAAGNGTNGSALRVTIASDSTGVVQLAAGTNGIGKLTANSGVDIGDVDVTSCALPTGAATAAKQPALGTAGTASADVISVQGIASMTPVQVSQATAGNLNCTEASASAIKTAVEALDNAVDGNYLNVNVNVAGTDAVSGSGTATGAIRVELPTNGTGVIATVGAVTAITNALPAGTNAIGKLASNSGVDIGDVDILSIAAGDNNIGNVDIASIASGTNSIGQIQPSKYPTTDDAEYVNKYYTSAGAATDGIIWSPAAGKRWYVTDLIISVSAATTVTLEDDKAGGDNVVLKLDLAANGGMALSFKTPLASGEDAADLMVTTSAGNIYITANGYEV